MEKSEENIEVGCGAGDDLSAFTAGKKAGMKAISNIHEHALSAVLVFASVNYDLEEVLRGISSVTGDAPVLGATTAGEICNGVHKKSVVAVALASPFLKVYCGVGRNVSKNWQKALDEAIDSPQVRPFFEYNAEHWQELILRGKNVFAMVFSPGNTRHNDSRSYEILEMLKIKSLGRLPVIGGAAADDWRMEKNFVLLGRKAYPDSVLVAIFETQLKFGMAVAHGFRETSRKTTVTSVEGHEVLTLDGLPAADVYAGLVDSSRDALDGKHLTLTTGFTVGTSDPMGQYSVNAASYFTERGGVRLTQPVTTGTVLTVMEPDTESMVEAGRSALRKAMIRGRITYPAFALVFYCALRPIIIAEKSSKKEFSGMLDMMDGKPLVGFYSFGEQGLADDGVSRHNNSGISVLIFGKSLSQSAHVASLHAKAEERIHALNEELQGNVKKLEAINDDLESFNYTLAHDLNTPLRIIDGFSRMLEKYYSEKLDDEGKQFINTIRENAQKMDSLLRALLKFSRLGHHKIEKEDIDMSELANAVSRELIALVPERTIRLDIGKLPQATGERVLIHQVFVNLLSNAIKFTLHRKKAVIEVGGRSDRDENTYYVRDNGVGFDMKHSGKLFGIFKRLHNEKEFEGTGVGLAIVRRIVEKHGGRVWVEGKPGKGATFYFTIPKE